MSVVAPATSSSGDAARADWDGARSPALPYGEVRVGPGELAIGVESLRQIPRVQRGLYEQAVAAAGVDPDNVLVVRIAEASIEVDVLDPDDARWPVRTQRITPAELRQRASVETFEEGERLVGPLPASATTHWAWCHEERCTTRHSESAPCESKVRHVARDANLGDLPR
jgi:hypothetical protein